VVLTTDNVCVRRGCGRPLWKDELCVRCWRLCQLFSKDVRMFAYEPLDGYRDERDAVELPWEHWEQQAGARGVVDLFAEPAREPPDAQPPGG